MTSKKPDTLFAPAERYNDKELILQKKYIDGLGNFIKIYNSTSSHTLIVNNLRQAIFASSSLLNYLGINSIDDVLGKRPGELFNCSHTYEGAGGCGTSEACKYCSLVNTLLDSISTQNETFGNGSISGVNDTLNISVNVVPFKIKDEVFYIITLIDMKDLLRKKMLERVFFHDIINSTGALRGLIEMLINDVPDNLKNEVDFVRKCFNDLIEEIQFQKQIIDAENNDLVVDLSTLNSREILDSIQKSYARNFRYEGKNVIISSDSEEVIFRSDSVILKRILKNMVKNALEAINMGEDVNIGCNLGYVDNSYIEFWVHNKTYIPMEVQRQIFSRFFSTKGEGRGIGTYSIKLLGERYLNGQVGFASDKNDGTTFYIRLPMNIMN